jgi:molybdopterin-containing oxidoreductase family iron-sulfur binding subunit
MTEREKPDGVKRRDFLKVLGVAGAAVGAAGCTDRTYKLIPYLVSPDETVPGVSNYYTSVCRECSAGCGILMETRDGRVTKLEGNPVHPVSRGALCARGQSAVQGLYNPDRYQKPMMRENGKLVEVTWDKALALLSTKMNEVVSKGQAGNAVFMNRHESGSFPAFLDGWLASFGMPAHLSMDPLADAGAIAANQQSYGVAWPSIDLGAAKLIISFGADFLETWGSPVTQQLDFADARAKLEGAPRFWYIGPRRSLTGLNADEWLACKPGTGIAIAQMLAGTMTVAAAAQATGVPAAKLVLLQKEFAAAKPSVVMAGGHGGHATDLALAVNALNKQAGNIGATVLPGKPLSSFEGISVGGEVVDAIGRMRAGQVPIAFVRGVNPLYFIPKAAKVDEAFAKVPFKVSFSSYPDETSEMCDLVLPDHHPLESWGDAQAMPGVLTPQQPGMDPVYDTRQTADVLIAMIPAGHKGYYQFRDYRSLLISRYPGGATAFTAALVKGVGSGTADRSAAKHSPVKATLPAANIDATAGDLYFFVYPSPLLGDGSGANKPWLQELPDPVTKVLWQSVIEIHPETAAKLGIDEGDVVTVESAAGKVSAPAYLYMGLQKDTVAMAAGQGHTAYGRYAKGIGVNASDAVPMAFDTKSFARAWTATKVKLSKTGDYKPIVTTAGSNRQHGRGIGQAMTVAQLHEKPETPEHIEGDASHEFLPGLRAPVAQDAQGDLKSDDNLHGMYAPDHWSGMAKRRWAMTIDLARCTGCSACVTACYAENNIPTVGAPYQHSASAGLEGQAGGNILRGREMNWLRLERYWEGGEDGGDFDARFVPMLCQHCGNAPCEPVCPVYATYHSPDGLNVQVYNRCVGTRYCSNNCPYKVRYFNWFGYGERDRPQYAWPERMNWQLNPDVTVRGKGVMEKCTMCVQRIRETENRAKLEGRPVAAEEFTTACAQACPSRAITFGDAADPAWSVARLAVDRRAYHVFEELNTYTAVVYLKKVLHPAPGAPAQA